MLGCMSAALTALLDSPAQATVAPAPRLRRGTIGRDRLVRRLVQSTDVPLIVLCAPAGYGKTTLLGQWAARDGRPFIWIAPEAVATDAVLEQARQLLED